jgi:IS30 family transposase
VVSGKGKGWKSCLLVLTERASRNQLIFKMKAQTQECVIDTFNKLEILLGEKFPLLFKTITFDNGSEFLNWQNIENSAINPQKKRTKTYFCHPYSSWERGSNEVNNKLIRIFIKKGSNIDLFSNEDILLIQNWMNDYPRKMFNYKSARQMFRKITRGLAWGI